MTRTKYLEVSNFTLKFGDKNLLDLVEEVVIPAFMHGHTRKYGKITYFFHEVSILELSDDNEEPLACIAGRFIKDTVLTQGKRILKGIKLYRQLSKDKKF
jgi:hypothetical protein